VTGLEEWLRVITKDVITVIDAMVLLIITVGTIEAFVQGIRFTLVPTAGGHERRAVWLQYGRWLVAGLSFQLAADIINTSIAPTMEELARLGFVAAIRVFLNFFLERDISDLRKRQLDDSQDTKGAPERGTSESPG
jgi:uncharacterized membrane protein